MSTAISDAGSATLHCFYSLLDNLSSNSAGGAHPSPDVPKHDIDPIKVYLGGGYREQHSIRSITQPFQRNRVLPVDIICIPLSQPDEQRNHCADDASQDRLAESIRPHPASQPSHVISCRVPEPALISPPRICRRNVQIDSLYPTRPLSPKTGIISLQPQRPFLRRAEA